MDETRNEQAIDEIVARVGESKKYRRVCESTVRRIAAAEWNKRPAFRAALKATRSRLHQVYGAYEAPLDYERAYQALAEAYAQGSVDAIRQASREVMGLHASTRERLPILEELYGAVFSRTGAPRSVLDLACGLNPLALPWMGLSSEAQYEAIDIDGERTAFLNRFFALAPVRGRAVLGDLVDSPPDGKVDVALLMKSSACLERQQSGCTLRLLDALRARFVVVTFPAHSLGRRQKGMPEHYTRWMEEMAAGRPWDAARMEFEGEVVFVIDKHSGDR